ncbi:MAG: hypothetical protein DRP78_07370 [Candidatus Omnitrophota bacterium]|nr:MAG: hypothetical protein DRP78_07370 [Candidatus Omnitrophota bacterium]
MRNVLPEIKNINLKLERVLSAKNYALIKKIGRIADKYSLDAYLIGGFVRDLMLGVDLGIDFDILIEPYSAEFIKDLTNQLNAQVKFYPLFKTAKLKLPEGIVVDIAAARTETYKFPAALPIVKLSSLKNDLLRRDFIINTLALKLNKKGFGDLIDFLNAGKYIKEKKIRVLHELSFIDDPTRIFRAIRFEQRLNLQIDKYTQNLLKQALDAGMLDRLDAFRKTNELIFLLAEPNALKIIIRLSDLVGFNFINSQLICNPKMLKGLQAVEKILNVYRKSCLSFKVELWIVYLLGILDPLPLKDAEKTLKVFKFKLKVKKCLLFCRSNLNKIDISRQMSIRKFRDILEKFSFVDIEAILFLMSKSETKIDKN